MDFILTKKGVFSLKKIVLIILTMFLFCGWSSFVSAQESALYTDEYSDIQTFDNVEAPESKVKINRAKIFKDRILYHSYIKKTLIKNIRLNWFPYESNGHKKTTVIFKVNKNGELQDSSLKIYKSSDDEKFDKSALDAVSNAAPFKPFEVKYNENYIDILLRFDYYSDNPKAGDVLGNYCKVIETIIKRQAWGKSLGRYLVLQLTIDKDGKLLDVEVLNSSGSKEFDNWYIRKIEECEFPPVPDSISKGKIIINYVAKHEKTKIFNLRFWYNFKSEVLSIIGR